MARKAKASKVYFEVTNHCNFRCDFCPINNSRRKPQHMPFGLFTKGVDEIARDRIADTIGFHVLGEPLLYPHLVDALDYAREKGLRTEVTTNGALLTKERAVALAKVGLGLLTISLQIVDGDEHACRGTNLSFERYYERIMAAVGAISRSGTDTDVAISVMNTTTKKLLDVDKPMKLNGSGRNFQQRLAPLLSDLYAATGKPTTPGAVRRALGKLNLALPQLTRLRIDDHVMVHVVPFGDWGNAFTSRRVHPAPLGVCGFALRNVGVLSNGEVTICCPDYDGHTSLGNLHISTLGDLLCSQRAEAIREGFQRMRVTNPYCQRCLGSTNPVKALLKGLGSIYLFKVRDFRPGNIQNEVLLNPEWTRT